MKILYRDADIVVCVKPPRVLSTDEPGGMPSLLREELGTADVRSVHRLDRVVGGVMVYARSARAASLLSAQVRGGDFKKEYLAVVHGGTPDSGTMTDYLARDKQERKTYVAEGPSKESRLAVLDYETLSGTGDASLVRIHLRTGRTHQIRAQFSARMFPLFGDRKYSTLDDDCEIGLWSCCISFLHPSSNERMTFRENPPAEFPWTQFSF